MNRTPKMPPRPYYDEDELYRPERLFRCVAEILLAFAVLAGLYWWSLS